MPALRYADWVAQDRIAAAIHGPCVEVLRTIALQPVRGWQLGSRVEPISVPATRCCPTCGQLRPTSDEGQTL